MVADALFSHSGVDHYLRYIKSTDGREKVLRGVQYFCRFYAWYLYRTNRTASAIAAVASVSSQLDMARSIMRIGQNIDYLKAAAMVEEADPVLRHLTFSHRLCYAFYMTTDAICCIKALRSEKGVVGRRLQKIAYNAWLAGLICNVLAGICKLHNLKKEQPLEKTGGKDVVEEKALQRDGDELKTQIISDFCDIMVACATLDYVALDDGVVGLAGVAGSWLGFIDTWRKTA